LDLTLDPIKVGADLSKIIDINPIYFDLNKFFIRTDAAIELDKIVKVMNENPTMVIELGSHTDSRGSDASNESLSSKRAKASAQYIKERITNPDRIYGKGFGESVPNVIDLSSDGGTQKQVLTEAFINSFMKSDKKKFDLYHQMNRRTEFIIIKM
jgi:outer membrane protein OmpA-like peptidoglycan-associated protein